MRRNSRGLLGRALYAVLDRALKECGNTEECEKGVLHCSRTICCSRSIEQRFEIVLGGGRNKGSHSRTIHSLIRMAVRLLPHTVNEDSQKAVRQTRVA